MLCLTLTKQHILNFNKLTLISINNVVVLQTTSKLYLLAQKFHAEYIIIGIHVIMVHLKQHSLWNAQPDMLLKIDKLFSQLQINRRRLVKNEQATTWNPYDAVILMSDYMIPFFYI